MQVNIRTDHLKDVSLEPNWTAVPSFLAQQISSSLEVQQLGFRNDAATGVIFAQQLQAVSNRVRERAYPQFKAKNLIPVQNEAPFGAEEFAYFLADVGGMFDLIANAADDLPLTSVKGEKKIVNINAYGGAAKWTIFDIARATLAGQNLNDREMMANRFAAEKKLDQIAWVGDPKAGTFGLYNAPNVTRITAPAGAGGARWANKTGEEIYKDLIAPYLQQAADTSGTEQPNTKVLTSADFAQANTKYIGDLTGDTAMGRFRKDYPGVRVETVEWLQGANIAENFNAMIDFNASSDKIGLEVPRPYTVMPPEPRNLAVIVNAYMTTAGTIVYFPLSVTVTEGL